MNIIFILFVFLFSIPNTAGQGQPDCLTGHMAYMATL